QRTCSNDTAPRSRCGAPPTTSGVDRRATTRISTAYTWWVTAVTFRFGAGMVFSFRSGGAQPSGHAQRWVDHECHEDQGHPDDGRGEPARPQARLGLLLGRERRAQRGALGGERAGDRCSFGGAERARRGDLL